MSFTNKETKLVFHNGMRTIGGTLVEIIYKKNHIYFDFGSIYNPSAPIQPTDLQGLLDEEMAVFTDNIFDPAIPLSGYVSKPDAFENTAVFLSHMHLDHSKLINYLNPTIPLYTLEGTKSLLETLNINNDFIFPLANPVNNETVREITGVKDYETVSIGEIKVKLLPVDHDAFGACGMIITTPDLVISYTGDIRTHGYRKEDTLRFCEESRECDVLISEGVSISFSEIDEVQEHMESEPELTQTINDTIANNPNKQITFNYYISNVERIANIIKSCKRKVVLDAYYAYVLKKAMDVDAYYYALDGKDYGLNPNLAIDFQILLKDTNEFFWQLDTQAMKYFHQLREDGIYIHSNASPLGEFDPAYAPFVEGFSEKNITFILLPCSGHAYPQDLVNIVQLIKPKLLVPIHSFHPERLPNIHGDILLPEKNQTI